MRLNNEKTVLFTWPSYKTDVKNTITWVFIILNIWSDWEVWKMLSFPSFQLGCTGKYGSYPKCFPSIDTEHHLLTSSLYLLLNANVPEALIKLDQLITTIDKNKVLKITSSGLQLSHFFAELSEFRHRGAKVSVWTHIGQNKCLWMLLWVVLRDFF